MGNIRGNTGLNTQNQQVKSQSPDSDSLKSTKSDFHGFLGDGATSNAESQFSENGLGYGKQELSRESTSSLFGECNSCSMEKKLNNDNLREFEFLSRNNGSESDGFNAAAKRGKPQSKDAPSTNSKNDILGNIKTLKMDIAKSNQTREQNTVSDSDSTTTSSSSSSSSSAAPPSQEHLRNIKAQVKIIEKKLKTIKKNSGNKSSEYIAQKNNLSQWRRFSKNSTKHAKASNKGRRTRADIEKQNKIDTKIKTKMLRLKKESIKLDAKIFKKRNELSNINGDISKYRANALDNRKKLLMALQKKEAQSSKTATTNERPSERLRMS